MKSVTRFLFVVSVIFALGWTTASYYFAWYAMTRLGQVYTMAELSEPAIRLILGAVVLKVTENIFEHNESKLFGTSKKEEMTND